MARLGLSLGLHWASKYVGCLRSGHRLGFEARGAVELFLNEDLGALIPTHDTLLRVWGFRGIGV